MSNQPVRKFPMAKASAFLSDADATMARLIKLLGPTRIRSEAQLSVYQSLVRAIAYQMISTRAAAAIHGRLEHACAVIETEKVLSLGETGLRKLGYSKAKSTSLLDLSYKFKTGVIPEDNVLREMPDDELVRCLTQVKGIGTWSVQMLMIFNLRRPDVFPATDLGVRKGHQLTYQLDEMLSAEELLEDSTAWQPYRTAAAWFFWRATDSVDWDRARGTQANGKVRQRKQ